MKKVYVVVNLSYAAAFVYGDRTLSDKRNDLKDADTYDTEEEALNAMPDSVRYDVECFVDMRHDKALAKKMIEDYCFEGDIESTSMLKNLEETGLIEDCIFENQKQNEVKK